MDATVLARIQFAANISFHILFPATTIAMGWILLFFKLRFNATGDDKWTQAYRFWIKVFALCFALGVVSGITMSFQFGTNWPGYMLKVGNIAGPLLGYEVLSAFFLEATFLGIMLFGSQRVSNGMHTLATFLVAAGTTLSAFWIIALNSWMQTPQGFVMINGQAHVTNWLEVVFNPSMPYRLVHMLLASGLTASFMVAGVSAYRFLRGDKTQGVMAAMSTGIFAAAILIPLQILAGDAHGLNTLEHQPAKIAAMEAVWHTEKGAPLVAFAVPNEKTQSNDLAVTVPKGASLILTHNTEGEIKGIDHFPAHPPVAPVFYAFRIMVGLGVLMLGVSWVGAWQIWRQKEPRPWLARAMVAMTFSGWLATLAGWYTTEIGRQPWLVQGLLTTTEAAAKTVTSTMIVWSLAMYLCLYALLLTAFISVLFYLARQAGNLAGTPTHKES